MNSAIRVISTILVFLLPSSMASPAPSDERDGARPEKWIRPAALLEGCEPAAGLQPRPASPPREMDPGALALQEARRRAEIIGAPKTDHRPSGSFIEAGSFQAVAGGKGSRPLSCSGSRAGNFGADRHVPLEDGTGREWNPTLVSSSGGRLFAAWTDNSLDYDFVRVCGSDDKGITWYAYGSIKHPSGHVREPCLTLAEGAYNRLILAYIIDVDGYAPRPEVAITGLIHWGPILWTLHWVPPSGSHEGYAKPVIWTDAKDFSAYYAYLTCEGIADGASGDVDICAWRSLNLGSDWEPEKVVMGASDGDTWRDPDGAYGTTDRNVFIAAYNGTAKKLCSARSSNYGLSYGTPAPVYTFTASSEPSHAVDPEIEASDGHEHVMLCCTRANGGADCIGQTYSTDCGATWTTLYPLDGYTAAHEFSPSLVANINGGSWHLCYSGSNRVYYSSRPQDLSDYWDPTPDLVDDAAFASLSYPGKGIACFQDTDGGAMVWADYRDGVPDYDIYFDHTDNTYDVFVPAEYAAIQEGMDEAPAGSTVRVSPGIYMECIDFKGKALTVRSADGSSGTVVDGQKAGSVVRFISGEGPDSVIEGFTLTNGYHPAGGGIHVDGGSPVIRSNVIRGNLASTGAGIYCYAASPAVYNNTLTENTASYAGGGLYVDNNSLPDLKNCILWGDTAPTGPEIFIELGKPKVTYCDVDGGWPGTGNINLNPKFFDPAGGDFHITYNSPCREKGSNVDIGPSEKDFEGDPRRVGTVDMGADEFTIHLYYLGDPTPGGDLSLRLAGTPGSTQTGFFMSGAVRPEPVTFPQGDWWLLAPLMGPYYLPPVPSSGIIDLSGTVPGSLQVPVTLYLQGMVGPPLKLSNLCTIPIE